MDGSTATASNDIRTALLWHTFRVCEILSSAREIASVALLAERERCTENVFHMLLKQCETHSVCLACFTDTAIEAISLALQYSIVFHIASRACETLWSAREIASVTFLVKRKRYTENVFHTSMHFSSSSMDLKFGTREYLGSLITNPSSKFNNSK